MEQQALQVKKAIPQQSAQILSTPKLTAPRPEIQQDLSVGQLVDKKPVSQLMENAQKPKAFGAPELQTTSVRKQLTAQESIMKKIPAKVKISESKPKPDKDQFNSRLIDFFRKHNIEVVEQQIVKKGTETDFIIKIPSPVGQLLYYCKAKNKKRCSETDLSSAFATGQLKKLPVLFVATGELTKKGNEFLSNEFQGITAKFI